MSRLLLPQMVESVLAPSERRSPRDSALLDLAVLNGFRASEIVAVNRGHIDLEACRIQRIRAKSSYWQPLLSCDWTPWVTLTSAAAKDQSPLFTSRQGRRLTRVDVWRLLRKIGEAEEMAQPLHTRALRHVLGRALAEQHQLPAQTIAAALGISHLNGTARYLPSPSWDDYPAR